MTSPYPLRAVALATEAELGPRWHVDSGRFWHWLHNGQDVNGWLEFGSGGVLRTSFGKGEGSWRREDDEMIASFGSCHHRLRLIQDSVPTFRVVVRHLMKGGEVRRRQPQSRGILVRSVVAGAVGKGSAGSRVSGRPQQSPQPQLWHGPLGGADGPIGVAPSHKADSTGGDKVTRPFGHMPHSSGSLGTEVQRRQVRVIGAPLRAPPEGIIGAPRKRLPPPSHGIIGALSKRRRST